MNKCKVLMIVFSNLYQDPRVTKMARSVTDDLEDLKVLAAKSELDWNRQEVFRNGVDYKCVFLGIMNNESGIAKKIINKIYTTLSMLIYVRKYKDHILHCHDLDAAVVGGLCKMFYGSNYIYDSHEVWLGKNNISKWMVPIITFFERWVVKNASSMISVSQSAANFFTKKYRTDKVRVVTNSVQVSTVRKTIRGDKFVVMYQGRHVENRGLSALAKSAEFLPKDVFKIVFRGFGNYEDGLKKIVKDLDKSSAEIEFLPPVPMTEMAAHASECHLAVVLTERTCLNHVLTVSNKLFEYAAVARPMLLSDVDEHILLCNEHNCGIITEVTPAKIAENILRIEQDKDLYQKISKGSEDLGYKRTWSKEVAVLKEIYWNVINEI